MINLRKPLTKENFWNEMLQKYPNSTKLFCAWIDKYKEVVGWHNLFGAHQTRIKGNIVCLGYAPKFHDVPYDMQVGIWIRFAEDTLNDLFEQPEYTYCGDLAEDIKKVFEEIDHLEEVAVD